MVEKIGGYVDGGTKLSGGGKYAGALGSIGLKTTKDIANILNKSSHAVNFHRNNIRKKIGLQNKKTNLTLQDKEAPIIAQ